MRFQGLLLLMAPIALARQCCRPPVATTTKAHRPQSFKQTSRAKQTSASLGRPQALRLRGLPVAQEDPPSERKKVLSVTVCTRQDRAFRRWAMSYGMESASGVSEFRCLSSQIMLPAHSLAWHIQKQRGLWRNTRGVDANEALAIWPGISCAAYVDAFSGSPDDA